MKARAELIALLVTLSVAYVFAADWPAYLGTQARRHLRGEGPVAHVAEGGPQGSLDRSGGRRIRRPGRQRRQGLHAGQRRHRRRQAAMSGLRHRQRAVELRLRRAGEVRSSGLANHAGGRWQQRLHVRTARRPVLHQHDDAEARLEQERLEGLWRRTAAQVGVDPEPSHLPRSGDRGLADIAGERGGLRQADRRAEVEITRALRRCRICQPVARQGRRETTTW